MAIAVSFHDPVQWDGWIRYHHESSYVGAGMSYVRGQVLTEDGRLVASFTHPHNMTMLGKINLSFITPSIIATKRFDLPKPLPIC